MSNRNVIHFFQACLLPGAAAMGLTACSPPDSSPPVPAEDVSQTSAATAIGPDYYTTNSIRDIMNTLIDPPADALWNSVEVVVDADGVHEYAPETDAQWDQLRKSAISIIEGANALLMPGRPVAAPGAGAEFPEYEFTPEEVAEKLAQDRQSWAGFAQGLQNAAIMMLDAVETRDLPRLEEWGAHLDTACEACHSRYWYRTGI